MKIKYSITAFKMNDKFERVCHTSDIGRLMQDMANHGLLVVEYHELSNNPKDVIKIPLGKGEIINDVLL